MEIQDILTLIQAVDEHKLTEFKLDDGNVKLSFKKEEAPQIVNVTGGGFQGAAGWAGMADMAAGASAAMAQTAGMIDGGNAAGADAFGAAGTAGANGTTADSGSAANGGAEIGSDKVVGSPLVGTFYNSASPEAEPFVKVGDTVKKGQVMGIIEAMKLMNEIECEFDGVVEAVLVGNEDVVEYGQPLFRIR